MTQPRLGSLRIPDGATCLAGTEVPPGVTVDFEECLLCGDSTRWFRRVDEMPRESVTCLGCRRILHRPDPWWLRLLRWSVQ